MENENLRSTVVSFQRHMVKLMKDRQIMQTTISKLETELKKRESVDGGVGVGGGGGGGSPEKERRKPSASGSVASPNYTNHVNHANYNSPANHVNHVNQISSPASYGYASSGNGNVGSSPLERTTTKPRLPSYPKPLPVPPVSKSGSQTKLIPSPRHNQSQVPSPRSPTEEYHLFYYYFVIFIIIFYIFKII
jgi:hypothetical protein